jgi:hypothetical protein
VTFACELRWLGGCSGPLEKHHVLSRGKLVNVRGGLEYCSDNAPILLADICHKHNTDRTADTAAARRYLIQRRVTLFGKEYVAQVLDGLRALCKTEMPDWRLEAILAARSKTPSRRPPEPPEGP